MLCVLIYKTLANEGLSDGDSLSHPSLPCINCLALQEGQKFPELDSCSVMGVSVPYTTAAGHLPRTNQTTVPQ